MYDAIVITCCFLYLIGIGVCSYKLSSMNKCNCFGKNKSTGVVNDEYNLV